MRNETEKICVFIIWLCALLTLLTTAIIMAIGGENPTSTNQCIAMMLLVLVITAANEERSKRIAVRHIQNKKKKGIKNNMKEFISAYIDKECLIYTISGQVYGTVKAVSDSALQVETKSGLQILNIDYVVRIREYPKNKNGKKKSIVID